VDFTLSDRMQDVLERMRRIVREDVIPLEPAIVGEKISQIDSVVAPVRKLVKKAGLWAPQIPKELGGMGLSLVEHGLVSEVLGMSPLGHYCFGCHAPDAGNIEILHLYGSDEQRKTYLDPLVAGETRSCFAMTEPGTPGSNPTELACSARLEKGEWIIDGRKWFTTGADGAAFAICMAVTDPDQDPRLRASMIIVPTTTPGYELVRNIPVMGEPGAGWASHGEVQFSQCRVPEANLLGGRGAGFLVAQERLGPGRIHHCMRWLGIAERAFELMVQRAAGRDMGHDRALSTKQIVQAWIAESRAAIDAARLLTLHTAWRIDIDGFHAAREPVSLIKFHVAKVLQDVLDRAIQVHGALGITSDTPLAFWWGHERGARIYDGPDEVHKVTASKRIFERYLANGGVAS